MSTLQKNMGGIMSTYTKMGRGDFVPEGFCPTLESSACFWASINAQCFAICEVLHIITIVLLNLVT